MIRLPYCGIRTPRLSHTSCEIINLRGSLIGLRLNSIMELTACCGPGLQVLKSKSLISHSTLRLENQLLPEWSEWLGKLRCSAQRSTKNPKLQLEIIRLKFSSNYKFQDIICFVWSTVQLWKVVAFGDLWVKTS